MSQRKRVFKIVIAGAGGVGKSTLINRVITGNFNAQTNMTIGVEFHLYECRVDNQPIVLSLWDLGGQQRFRFMLEGYVAGAYGALLLFDLSRMSSFDEIEQWIGICRKASAALPILLVGSKADLVDDHCIPYDRIHDSLKSNNLFDFVKISSKDGTNLDVVFDMLTRKIFALNKIES